MRYQGRLTAPVPPEPVVAGLAHLRVHQKTGISELAGIWYGGCVLVMDPFGDPLKVVTTAVTPVVMVSATAILISGVNSRYISISDRVRSLAREYRQPETSCERQLNIRRQMPIFHRRLHLVSWATRFLYAAVGCFVAVALLISASVSRPILLRATLGMFLAGLVLVSVAIVLQLLELQRSNQTIDIESTDVFDERGLRS